MCRLFWFWLCTFWFSHFQLEWRQPIKKLGFDFVWYKKRTRFSYLLTLDRVDSHEMSLLPSRLQFQRTVLDKTHNLTYITVSYGTINNRVTLLLPVVWFIFQASVRWSLCSIVSLWVLDHHQRHGRDERHTSCMMLPLSAYRDSYLYPLSHCLQLVSKNLATLFRNQTLSLSWTIRFHSIGICKPPSPLNHDIFQ